MIMKDNETTQQQAVIQWARLMARQRPELQNLYHVPNEARRTAATAGILKSMGMEPGIPDLILDHPAGRYHGLRIEMKYGKNNPTPAQIDWMRRMQSAGYAVACVWSAALAIRLLTEYVNLWPGATLTCDTPETRAKYGFPALRESRDWKGAESHEG